jgi:hypothetical protein
VGTGNLELVKDETTTTILSFDSSSSYLFGCLSGCPVPVTTMKYILILILSSILLLSQTSFSGSALSGIVISGANDPVSPIDPNQYTAVPNSSAGTVTKESSGGNLVIGMSNNGSGKVLFRPSGDISARGGVFVSGTPEGVAFVISDHTGWDGTGAWLGAGLGFTNTTQVFSGQLSSRNSTTDQFGQYLAKSDGFSNPSSSGWASGNMPWGTAAITPKTVPIYVGVHYNPTGTQEMRIFRGNPGPETWTLIQTNGSVVVPNGYEFGLLLFSLTGTQSFELAISEVVWDWDGSTWPF